MNFYGHFFSAILLISTGSFPYKLRNAFKIAHQQKQTEKQANKNFPLTPHPVGATA